MIVGRRERRRRYILCLNAEEAAREKRHRDEILDLLRLELDHLASDHPKAACRLVASKRFGPYLSLDAGGRPFIDRAKVRRAEQLDGKFVLTTNDDTLSAADVTLGYKEMWIIEACFRRLKTTGLGIRPMFHWTPRRIVAHVKLCVLALMIQRAAEIATGAPWSQLVDVLERLKAVRYTAEGETIVQIQPDHARARGDPEKARHLNTQVDPHGRLTPPRRFHSVGTRLPAIPNNALKSRHESNPLTTDRKLGPVR